MITELAIAVPAGLAIFGFAYKSYSGRQNKQDTKIESNTATCKEIQLHVATIQADVGHIKKDIIESKGVQQRIFDKIDELKDDFRSCQGS